MGGGGKNQRAPTPEPVPTIEEEREPTSKAIREREALRLRTAKGHRGSIVAQPLGMASVLSPKPSSAPRA